MTKVIDITGRQAKSGDNIEKIKAAFVGKTCAELSAILHFEIDPAYYEQVRKELLVTARKYAYKSRQRGIKP